MMRGKAAVFLLTTLFCLFLTIRTVSGAALRRNGNGVSLHLKHKEPWKPNTDRSHRDGWTYCGERKCRCQGDLADCSHNDGKLDFLPRLPESIRFVNFSFNQLHEMPANFFSNVTYITGIDISNNDLALINSEAFSLLGNLTWLLMDNNPGLTYAALDPMFSLSTLERLSVAGGNLGALPADLFHKHPLPNLEKLNLHGNDLELDDFAEFSPLGRLSDLDLSYNDIGALKTGVVLGLHNLNFGKNAVSQFPKTCKHRISLFPRLMHLSLRQNRVTSLAKEICLPALKHLDLGQNSISMLLTGSFEPQLFPSLTELYLDSMATSINRVEKQAFNNPSLELLSLSGNELDFLSIDLESFQGCLGLETLLLRNNFFGLFDENDFEQMFKTLTNLRQLDLTHVFISESAIDAFSELPSLCHLSLSNNSLFEIADGAFDTMFNLTDLDLSDNQFHVIKETTFNATTRERFQHLDLSGNPYTCSCALRWFQNWINEDRAVFNNSVSNYTCRYFYMDVTGPSGIFHLSDQACLLSEDAYVLMMGFTIYAMMFLFSGLYCLRNRFRMRKMIRRALGGNNNQLPQPGDNRNFEYDLFVAYAEGDEDWVHGQLMPELEERMGLRLCIHQRDFHPGRHILDNIEGSVNVSRKVMMVFSTSFARSEWCQFELTLCQRHVMDRGDCLIVALLHEIPDRDLTNGMNAILQTYTYLQWSEIPGDAVYFWNSLRLALHNVIHNVQR